MAQYDPEKDKTVKEIGSVILGTDSNGKPNSELFFKIRQYGDQEPKLAITNKFTGRNDTVYESSKIPRLTFEQLQFLRKDLETMLDKAESILDSSKRSKGKKKSKGKDKKNG
uniref:Transcriptional coactivator p15 (PC4) C-terminal domain-containing protein n=1 Tax=viral metagenome TaxID=1070528 RepID=A0A6M3IEU2_9ZZZZ